MSILKRKSEFNDYERVQYVRGCKFARENYGGAEPGEADYGSAAFMRGYREGDDMMRGSPFPGDSIPEYQFVLVRLGLDPCDGDLIWRLMQLDGMFDSFCALCVEGDDREAST